MSRCRFENLLSRFEKTRRYDVFTSETHRETVEENARLVDRVDELEIKLSESMEEISILGRPMDTPSPRSVGAGIRLTSAYLGSGGKVPAACPLGGCHHYESVNGVGDAMKNFQNHMNNTHRVCFFFYQSSQA